MQAIMLIWAFLAVAALPLIIIADDTISKWRDDMEYKFNLRGWHVYQSGRRYIAFRPGADPETANPGIVATRISQLVEWIDAIETADRRRLP